MNDYTGPFIIEYGPSHNMSGVLQQWRVEMNRRREEELQRMMQFLYDPPWPHQVKNMVVSEDGRFKVQ